MSDYFLSAKLSLTLSQALQLTGEPTATKDIIIIKDHDENPTITIHVHHKVVDFKYSTNIREVIIAGVIKMCEDAGFKVNRLPIEIKHPLEQLLEKIKPIEIAEKKTHH